MVALPSPAALCALPEALRLTVPAEYADANGHMNVRHHLAIHDDAGWRYFAELGFHPAYIAREQRNFFDLEHHLRYYAEVAIGDVVSVRVRLMARNAKVLHLMSFLLNQTSNELANTLELTTAHVDLRTRRTVALEPPHSGALDARLENDRALPWPAPTCGAIGVRP